MYTIENIQSILQNLFPYAHVSYGALGGSDIYCTVSYDQKDQWLYGYIENSKYSRFTIEETDTDTKILKSFVSCGTTKIRKTKIKSIEHLIEKITNWKKENTIDTTN